MISERFKQVIFKELKIENVEITENLLANEVPGWDSLSHANIISALEQEYKIRLKNIEVLNCENIGDLQALVNSKIKD